MSAEENAVESQAADDCVTDNPCTACAIHQDCCSNLTGLRLTQAEYDRHFAQHAACLDVETEAGVYLVSVKDGGACPNWDDGCTVYETRPVECGLFPHTIGVVRERALDVLVSFHARTTCPLKDDLIAPSHVSRDAVARFAHDAYGDARKVTIIEEIGFGFLTALVARVQRKLGLVH